MVSGTALPTPPSRFLATAIACSTLLIGCGAAPNSFKSSTAPEASEQQAVQQQAADFAQSPAISGLANQAKQGEGFQEQTSSRQTSNSPSHSSHSIQARPQLIKTARVTLEVEDAIASVRQIRSIVNQNQGDLLNLREETLPGDGSPRRAELELRIPQARLDATLDELTPLGEIKNRSITAEDVSAQLVDSEARLRNLRKQEEEILKIMERSGELSEVLTVSQELANVRQTIEQLDAQVSHLKTRVAYSTVYLSVAEPLAIAASRPSFGNAIKAAWGNAAQSSSDLGRGLLVMGIWFLAHSPYLLVLTALIYVSQRAYRRRSA